MKILLCALNSQYIHANLAVRSLAAYYGAHGRGGAEVRVRAFSVNETMDALLYGILREAPDAVGLSVYIWNVAMVTRLIRRLRAIRPALVIILGGPEVSFGLGRTGLLDTDYDYLITGEGETAFCRLADQLCAGTAGRCEQGEVIAGTPADLGDLPFIYTAENLPLFEGRILYYESSRGCPFRCAFCLSGGESGLRFLPLDRVKQELDFFIAAGVPLVKFVDRTFNCNPDRATELFRYIIEHPAAPATCFHFEIGGDLLTDEQLDLLAKARPGLIQFEIGVQSTHGKTLEACCRGADFNRLAEATRRLVAAGNINIHLDLIAGLPYEDYARFGRSFDEVYALRPHQLQLGFLKLLSGAPLNEQIEEHGYLFAPEPPYEILYNRAMSHEDVMRLKAVEDVIERTYNSGRFSLSMDFIAGFFERPFALYEAMAGYFDRQGLLFQPLASRRVCDALWGFAGTLSLTPAQMDTLRERLLLDFYASDRSDKLPDCLRHMARPAIRYKETATRLLRERELDARQGHTMRMVGDRAAIFHYGTRDPVTGRYPYAFVDDPAL